MRASLVAAKQELIQPIAEAADAIIEDDGGGRRRAHAGVTFGSYFQLRLLPSESHSIAVAMRFCRVASVFASVTHSTYSRRWLGLNASKAFRAAGFFFRAAAKSAGTRSGCLRRRRLSRDLDALVVQPGGFLDVGREVAIRRQIANRGDAAEVAHGVVADGPSSTRLLFQNPKAQCALNAAMLHIISPL